MAVGPASTYWTMKKQKFKKYGGAKALNIGVLLKLFFHIYIYVYFLKPNSKGSWKRWWLEDEMFPFGVWRPIFRNILLFQGGHISFLWTWFQWRIVIPFSLSIGWARRFFFGGTCWSSHGNKHGILMVQRPIRTTPKGTILERNIRPCGNKYLQIQETKNAKLFSRNHIQGKRKQETPLKIFNFFSIKKKSPLPNPSKRHPLKKNKFFGRKPSKQAEVKLGHQKNHRDVRYPRDRTST